MEFPEANGPSVPPEGRDTEEPRKTPWAKLAVVMLIVVLVVAALAILARRPNRAPVVSQATVNLSSPQVDQVLTFTARAMDPDGDALDYSWDFGDGSRGTGSQATHSYGLPGKFVALVVVRDGKGGESTNDADLLRVPVAPKAADIAAPNPCGSAPCSPGPVVAVLNATSWMTFPASVAFDGNDSWAYSFAWNNPSNHSEGGTYALVNASGNPTLFAMFRYEWGDGTANTTGTSELVGMTTHAFRTGGNYFVRLMVTYVHSELIPSTKSASAGYTVRVVPQVAVAGSILSPPDSWIVLRLDLLLGVARAGRSAGLS